MYSVSYVHAQAHYKQNSNTYLLSHRYCSLHRELLPNDSFQLRISRPYKDQNYCLEKKKITLILFPLLYIKNVETLTAKYDTGPSEWERTLRKFPQLYGSWLENENTTSAHEKAEFHVSLQGTQLVENKRKKEKRNFIWIFHDLTVFKMYSVYSM